MLKKAFWTILVILFLKCAYAGIQINEIMANPSCSESYCEYIEVHNVGMGSVNVTGWNLSDNSDEDILESYDGGDIIIPGGGFALIVDTDSRVYSNFDIGNVTWVYVDDSALGGSGLSNSGENISLKDLDGVLKDSVSYNSSNDGLSFSLINGNWGETPPSAGKDNIENTSSSKDYSTLSISEFLPNPEGEDTQAMEKGEWVELYNSGSSALDLLGFELYDNSGSSADVVITNTTTSSGTVIGSEAYLTVYMNGVSGFLNNNGYDKIKIYDLDGNLIEEVSYEGSDEDVSWALIDGKWEKASPTLGTGNLDNGSAVQSEIRIDEIYDLGDGKAEWGDVVRVKMFVYRGNTGKQTIWMWVEDVEGERVTKKSKFTVSKKFQNYTFTYPLGLPGNCGDEYTSGHGKVMIEGLGEEKEEILEIREKPLCKDGSRKVRLSDFEYELVKFSETIEDNEEISLDLKLKSNKEDLKVDVWSYVFSGKKHFSEDNKKTVALKKGKEETVELKMNIKEALKAKSPRLKVKILKEGRKTPYDITEEVEIVEGGSESVKKGFEDVSGSVVYEGKSKKAERTGVFFFSGLMAFMGLHGFVIRKWKILK
jgi:hypothetical protein